MAMRANLNSITVVPLVRGNELDSVLRSGRFINPQFSHPMAAMLLVGFFSSRVVRSRLGDVNERL